MRCLQDSHVAPCAQRTRSLLTQRRLACHKRPVRRRKAQDLAAGAYRPSRTRLTQTLLDIPTSLDEYFQTSLARRVLWCWISLFMGYYAGNMVSLSFGALAINDVVAAMMTVAVYEVISKEFYRQWPRPTLWITFANFFKIGVTFAFTADAWKLGG